MFTVMADEDKGQEIMRRFIMEDKAAWKNSSSESWNLIDLFRHSYSGPLGGPTSS